MYAHHVAGERRATTALLTGLDAIRAEHDVDVLIVHYSLTVRRGDASVFVNPVSADGFVSACDSMEAEVEAVAYLRMLGTAPVRDMLVSTEIRQHSFLPTTRYVRQAVDLILTDDGVRIAHGSITEHDR